MNRLMQTAPALQRSARTILGVSILLILCLLASVPRAAFGSANPQIVVDPTTGLALYGYDPVAYFVDGQANAGDEEFEKSWGGVAWRFVNIGNLKAFIDAPDVYCPRYGGYGALSVARGLTTPGKPVFFELYGGKLYFFYSQANRHIWLDDPEAYIAQADMNWTAVKQQLVH